MKTVAADTKLAWTPMALRHVGDVGLVMNRKSGTKRDPGQHHRKKRKHGFFD